MSNCHQKLSKTFRGAGECYVAYALGWIHETQADSWSLQNLRLSTGLPITSFLLPFISLLQVVCAVRLCDEGQVLGRQRGALLLVV